MFDSTFFNELACLAFGVALGAFIAYTYAAVAEKQFTSATRYLHKYSKNLAKRTSWWIVDRRGIAFFVDDWDAEGVALCNRGDCEIRAVQIVPFNCLYNADSSSAKRALLTYEEFAWHFPAYGEWALAHKEILATRDEIIKAKLEAGDMR